MRPRLAIAALVAAVAFLGGCAGGAEPDTADADPADLLRILPTPAGLTASGGARAVAEPDMARAFGDPAAVEALQQTPVKRAAAREWTGPGGRRLVVVAGVWAGPQTATLVTAAAAERPLTSGGRAWTAEGIGGSRGAVAPGPPAVRTLSFAVGATGVFLRAEGPVAERAVTRTADLLETALRG